MTETNFALDRNTVISNIDIVNESKLTITLILRLISSTTQSRYFQGRDEIAFDTLKLPTIDDRIRDLEEIIPFENATSVAHFLSGHSLMIDFITEAIKHIRKQFKGDRFTLRHDSDPESEDTGGLLLLKILTDSSRSGVADKLARFDQDWWLDNKSRTENRLIIKEEFV